MPLSSDLIPFYIKNLKGMNNKGDPLEFQDQFVLTAQNCRFDPEPGGVSKREPIYYFNSASVGSTAMMALYRYYKSDGTTKFVGVCGTGVYVGDDTLETFTSIRTLTSTGKRCSFLTYKDLLMGSNGYDNLFVYDGGSENVTWELGACKSWTGSSQANLTVGSVQYQVTIDTNDAYVCGAVSNVITLTACAYELTNIPLGPTGVAYRKIYRQTMGSGGFFYVGSVSGNTLTTYTDVNTTQSSAALPTVTDDMPVGAELQLYREKLFITRDPSNPNLIYYSNSYLPHYIQQTTNLDYMQITPNDNDEIAGIPVFLGSMVCIKKNNIRKLYLNGPPEQWYSEDPFLHTGSPAPWSICPTPYGIAYLGWDHWYMYDGANSNLIIDEFDTYDILAADYDDTVSFYQENELLAAYTVTPRAQAYHDRVMRYNFKRKALAYDLMNVNCFAAKRGDDESGELYFGDSTAGYVYKGVQEDLIYKVSTKNDCNSGAVTNAYVGGTESNPYIEIGNSITASSIPTNTVVLWDSTSPPDSGWTEITTYDNRYIRVGTTATITGATGVSISEAAQATTAPVTVSYLNLKAYYKNNTTTVNTFPIGSIILWDQTAVPDGFFAIDPGYYLRVCSTSVNTIGTDNLWVVSGTGGNLDNFLTINAIKRAGELGTWDGSAKYAYLFGYNSTIGTSGWTDVSGSYSSSYIKTAQAVLADNGGGDSEYNVNYVRMTTTAHVYEGGGTGANSIDGNENTAQSNSYSGGGGSGSATLYSTHTFATVRNVTQVKYKLHGSATSVGAYSQNQSYALKVEYKVGTTWTTLPGSSYSGSHSGSGSVSYNTGLVTYDCDLKNVVAIRAYAYAASDTSDGGGSYSGDANIFEIQAYGKFHDFVEFPMARKILGKLGSYNGSWETNSVTAGTWTSTVAQISADAFVKLWWNESLVGTDNALLYFRTGATAAACTTSSWSTAYTDPNGISIANVTGNTFCQFKIELSATDTTVSNPKVYAVNGYVVKYTYSKGATAAESAVEFIYDIGFRHFDQPMIDKIFKKIQLYHDGSTGTFTVDWETENASSSFTIDLTTNPERWSSFFPDNAMGKQMKIRIYKNDLNPFTLKEIQGIFSPEPLQI